MFFPSGLNHLTRQCVSSGKRMLLEDELDERQLIERVLAGDAAAERSLYDAHVDRIYRLAYRMTGDETMAADITQDTFIRAFDRLGGFEGRSSLSTWLHAITVTVALNRLRKVKRLRRRETELDNLPAGAAAVRPIDQELKIQLHTAIDKLDDNLRLVFVMHDIEGYKHREIAAILNVPEGTSKNRLFRAHQLLREELARGDSPSAQENGS
jgi:RNA polymerase sigma-70 factor (ECF subfamily)